MVVNLASGKLDPVIYNRSISIICHKEEQLLHK